MLSLIPDSVPGLRRHRAQIAGTIAALAAALGGCSDEEARPAGITAGWPGAVELRPVTHRVQGEGAARLIGRGPGAELEVRVRGLPPFDGAYVVWLYNATSDAVGVARVARGSFALRTRLTLDPARYRYIDISREPLDGNRNHSGASVLRVRTARLLLRAR
jgi:hypothetical protein